MGTWHSDETRARAIKMVNEEGYSHAEVGKLLGIPYKSIYHWLKTGPTRKQRPPHTKHATKLHDQALALIKKGHSQGEVARQLGLHQTTVGGWARKAGVGPGRPDTLGKRAPVPGHTPEYKQLALEKAKAKGSLARAADELGLNKATLQRWKAESDRAVRLARRVGLEVEKKAPPPAPAPEPPPVPVYKRTYAEGKTVTMDHTDEIAEVKTTLKARIAQMSARLAALQAETKSIEAWLPMLTASLAALEGGGGLKVEVSHVDPVAENDA